MIESFTNWDEIPLGDICEIATGKFDANHATQNGKYRFYTCAYEYMFCDTNRFNGESIILPGNGANVGEVFYYKGEFDAYQRTYVLSDIKCIPKFLFYHLKFKWKDINSDKQYGSATNYIRMGNFTDYLVPFPPFAEQQRIVYKIEELFSELDKGIETLKTAQQQLKVYRQAVLKYAFEGKFTNSKNQFKIYQLGEIVDIVSGSTPKDLNEYLGSGLFQFYKVSDMNLEDNKVEMKSSNHLISEQNIKKLKLKVYPEGTIIFPKRGGAILTNKKRMLSKPSSFDLNLMGVLPNENINKYFLYYWFLKLDLSKIYDGSSVPQINNKNIYPLQFPLFSIENQLLIVQEIESRLSVCDKIEESIGRY